VAQIAWRHGIGDAMKVWDHPENAGLKARRGDPNLLHPGDRLFIPVVSASTSDVATGMVHRFVIRVPKSRLRLAVHDEDNQPLASRPFKLKLGSKTHEGTTDGNGIIDVAIPVTATSGELEIDDHVLPIFVGQLDPVAEPSGVGGRLENLGFLRSQGVRDPDEALQAAVGRFQAQHGLEVTSEINDETRHELEERHGC